MESNFTGGLEGPTFAGEETEIKLGGLTERKKRLSHSDQTGRPYTIEMGTDIEKQTAGSQTSNWRETLA